MVRDISSTQRPFQVLDVCTTVTPNYMDLKEVVLFMFTPNSLDPSAALGLYVKAGSSEWLYRGAVHNGHPSEVMPLQVSAYTVYAANGFLHSCQTPTFSSRLVRQCSCCSA